MKKLYPIILVAVLTFNLQLVASNCSAQYVIIPDANFAAWLRANTALLGLHEWKPAGYYMPGSVE